MPQDNRTAARKRQQIFQQFRKRDQLNMRNQDLFPADDLSELFVEKEATTKPTVYEKSFTWSTEMTIEYKLIGHTIQNYLKHHAENWFTIAEKRSAMVRFGTSLKRKRAAEDNMMMTGVASFVMDGKLCCYEADYSNDTHRIYADHDVTALIEQLQEVIRSTNSARKHYLQFYTSSRDIQFHVRPTPSVALDEVILNPRMLEDIVDNTISHLDYVDGANGVIFHGAPGTGKSLAAQAIAAEALRKGYCAAYVAGRIDFEKLDEFVREYLTPGVLILEDIDTFTESRKTHQQYGFSDFLQFMSGLFERNQKTVVIATTNHLKFLDDAIATRPVRFNRRYEFGLPSEVELERLFAHFFPNFSPDAELIEVCRRRGFSGSHLAEVKRTSQILQHKRSRPIHAVIAEAVEIVGGEFSQEQRHSGF
jgi:hypothetical protein